MEAVAQHDFVATNQDELSFTKGSIVKVFARSCLQAMYSLGRSSTTQTTYTGSRQSKMAALDSFLPTTLK
jgi:hypothetical protein